MNTYGYIRVSTKEQNEGSGGKTRIPPVQDLLCSKQRRAAVQRNRRQTYIIIFPLLVPTE